MTVTRLTCPLCHAEAPEDEISTQDGRTFQHCPVCDLVFVSPAFLPGPAEERAQYDHHENSPEDAGYVRFLEQLATPMLPYLKTGWRGLDYGSGPNPTLSGLFRAQGLTCDDYDPVYGPLHLEPPYDFIVSTECFEHFHRPYGDLVRICDLLAPGGLLGVMTLLWTDLHRIPEWHYARDITHTTFYHARTFDYMEHAFGLHQVWSDSRRVVILRADSAARAACSGTDA